MASAPTTQPQAQTSPDSKPPRVALVTGAAQGLGEGIARRFADDGLDVALADLPTKREQLEAVAQAVRASGRRALVLVGDVTQEAAVAAWVKDTAEGLGGVDVMVANAGLFFSGPVVDVDVEKWDRLHSVNVRGVMLSVKHAARQMIAQGRGGVIIPAASLAGQKGYGLMSMYCASKFAVRAITQSASDELRPHNISVMAYAPGFIKTPMIAFPEDEVNGAYMTIKKNLLLPPDFPVDEVTTVQDLVSYMIRPEAAHLSGQCLNMIDGKLITEQ